MSLSISENPRTLLNRALVMLDIGIDFYTNALKNMLSSWDGMTMT